MSRAVVIATVATSLTLVGCGGTGKHAATTTSSHPVAVGVGVPARSIAVAGAAGTLQLKAVGLGTSPGWAVLATLAKPVARERKDICFGLYTTTEGPAGGDLRCSVRGPARLVSVLDETSIPNAGPLTPATILVGQGPPGVVRVELLGPDRSRELQLSPARMFLAVFRQQARGRVQIRAALSNGRILSAGFTLPRSAAQIRRFSDRYRRPGAVFNDEIGENIVGTPYRRIVTRFGPPLAILKDSNGQRCVYYDVVGSDTGWSFCFKHSTMTGAAGNQNPPSGVN